MPAAFFVSGCVMNFSSSPGLRSAPVKNRLRPVHGVFFVLFLFKNKYIYIYETDLMTVVYYEKIC